MPGIHNYPLAQRQAWDARLGRELTLWLATTRSDGRPHLVPVWFTWYDDKLYICTIAGSEEMLNLERTRRAAVALPDTGDVLIVEGLVNLPRGELIDVLSSEFNDKYGWDPYADQGEDWRLVEILPSEVLSWNTEED